MFLIALLAFHALIPNLQAVQFVRRVQSTNHDCNRYKQQLKGDVAEEGGYSRLKYKYSIRETRQSWRSLSLSLASDQLVTAYSAHVNDKVWWQLR